MGGHRLLYCTALVCCGMFSIAYGQWLSGLALAVVLGLPLLSLLLSLPALATFRLKLHAPSAVTMGQEAQLRLERVCYFPGLPFRSRLRLTDPATGASQLYQSQLGLPTSHCGCFQVTAERARVYDYLGLTALPIRCREQATVLIRPLPLAIGELPELKRYIARSWRPKFGGGYGEKHELRLYRPGDSLNQVHWKLSAKTGKLTIREPMEPQRGLILLTMDLLGTQEERDRKFGRLLWLGNYLAEQEMPFELRVLTGQGVQAISVPDRPALDKAIDQLLAAPLAREGSIQNRTFTAAWQYHLGGEADEI